MKSIYKVISAVGRNRDCEFTEMLNDAHLNGWTLDRYAHAKADSGSTYSAVLKRSDEEHV